MTNEYDIRVINRFLDISYTLTKTQLYKYYHHKN